MVKRETAWQDTRPHVAVLILKSPCHVVLRFFAWTREDVSETKGGHTAEGGRNKSCWIKEQIDNG